MLNIFRNFIGKNIVNYNLHKTINNVKVNGTIAFVYKTDLNYINSKLIDFGIWKLNDKDNEMHLNLQLNKKPIEVTDYISFDVYLSIIENFSIISFRSNVDHMHYDDLVKFKEKFVDTLQDICLVPPENFLLYVLKSIDIDLNKNSIFDVLSNIILKYDEMNDNIVNLLKIRYTMFGYGRSMVSIYEHCKHRATKP